MDKKRRPPLARHRCGALLIYKWGIRAPDGQRGERGRSGHPGRYVRRRAQLLADTWSTTPGQVPIPPDEGALCEIHGNRFNATLSSRGAGITHFLFTDPQYATE